jgi:SpoVK/Ycf46/Vps4 family AAA+-type ATPase
LWRAVLGPGVAVDALAENHRHAAGRIVELGLAARSVAARAGTAIGTDHVAQAARAGVGADLGALAELLADDIADEALVLAPSLRQALDALLARCRVRDRLADTLGVAARARYRPGVRCLLVGPSGTGKTLAAGWIATRLGLPLYRVDLASVTSKYIGETEKNLADLFARAEHAEVVLLFDEADSLFGKRTDVKDANDRFANQQTNYLLQRIESYEGITLLTSNSRARFDSAFTRRLDAIIDFPAPGPEERRALWLAHLGDGHGLDPAALNRLAAGCDLAGGHIRNAVFGAASLATQRGGALCEADLLAAVATEYRKLGKPSPMWLASASDGTGERS